MINIDHERSARQNVKTTISNLTGLGGPPSTRGIQELAAIAEYGSELERDELQRHRQYLVELTNELEAGAKQLRELISKLIDPEKRLVGNPASPEVTASHTTAPPATAATSVVRG